MNQILRITIGLIITCCVAGLVMGGVFTLTHEAKKHNEHLIFEETMLGLLGYKKGNPPPPDLRFYTIYRYLLEDTKDPSIKELAYMVPVTTEGKEAYKLLILTQEGGFKGAHDLKLDPQRAFEPQEREKALDRVFGQEKRASSGDSIIVVTQGNKRVAYLLPGRFPGFKTMIKVMLALEPDYTIKGLEVMEHEEDPGLGGEITQDYFKNQFAGKPFSKVKELKVVKEPLPDEYKKVLEATQLPAAEREKALAQFKERDIYALTGATISSKAVTEGVKAMAKNFAYRFENLEKVVKAQGIQVSF